MGHESGLRWALNAACVSALAIGLGGCIGGGATTAPETKIVAPSDRLDANEQKRADTAVLDAVAAGSPRRWNTDRPGFYGYVEPGPSVNVGDGQCREFTHTMFIDGRAKKEFGRACKGGTGAWALMPPTGA